MVSVYDASYVFSQFAFLMCKKGVQSEHLVVELFILKIRHVHLFEGTVSMHPLRPTRDLAKRIGAGLHISPNLSWMAIKE